MKQSLRTVHVRPCTLLKPVAEHYLTILFSIFLFPLFHTEWPSENFISKADHFDKNNKNHTDTCQTTTHSPIYARTSSSYFSFCFKPKGRLEFSLTIIYAGKNHPSARQELYNSVRNMLWSIELSLIASQERFPHVSSLSIAIGLPTQLTFCFIVDDVLC